MNEYIKYPISIDIAISELISIHYFEYTKDYKYPGESYDFWEIMYVDRGKVFVTCNQNEYLLPQGALIFLPPDFFHTIKADEIAPSNIFIISFTEETSVLSRIKEQVIHLSSDMKKLIHSIMQEGAFSFELPMSDRYQLSPKKNAPFGSQQLIKLRLKELIIQIIRKKFPAEQYIDMPVPSSKSQFDDQIAGQILQLLKKHIYGNLSLDTITGSLGYGKTYLSIIFRKVYGESIMSYYTKLKIEEAKYLIRSNTMSISEISALLGFSSPQYFSKRFRQFVHMASKQYSSSVKETFVSFAKESSS